MKKILHLSVLSIISLISYSTSAQDVYWRENFTDVTPSSDPAAGSTFGTTTGAAGEWGFYGVWRTTGTSCPYSDATANPHVRSTSNAGLVDTAYIITPLVNNGISKFSILRSRSNRLLTVYTTTDVSITTTNWTLVTVLPKSTASPTTTPCGDTTIIINAPTAKRLQFRFERAVNSDVDSVVLWSSTPLPVKWAGISATEIRGQVRLTWNIASEDNVSKYIVERSSNGSNFSAIGEASATNSKSYTWNDASPFSGNNFYRVMAVDLDGKTMYSTIVKIGLGKGADINIAPNPVKGGVINVQVGALEKGSYSFKVFNNMGQQLLLQNIQHQGGAANYHLQLPASVKGGIYSLQINGESTFVNKKIVIQ